MREHSLAWIWQRSALFQRFRGTDWMPEPCRSCDRRELDFGGCRCQAFLLTGNAAATDPVCRLSPDHGLIEKAREAATETQPTPFIYRSAPAREIRSERWGGLGEERRSLPPSTK